jgi:hypothetical protein
MPVVGSRQGDAPLFLSRREKRLSADNFVKRELKPILNKLGLDGALHAFRHGNATALDHMNAPLKVSSREAGARRGEDDDGLHAPGQRGRPAALRETGQNFVP